jgi:hypothetical protein
MTTWEPPQCSTGKVMISRRDTYLMALARSATLDIQRNQMGCAALANTGLSVTDRIRETEDRLRLMLRDSREGIWPTLPTIFDAMAYLASHRADR